MANPVIQVYSKEQCPYCANAKALLRSKRLKFEKTNVTSDVGTEQEMITRSQHRTVPQIFIDDCSIGGYDDLSQLNATSKLNQFFKY